jgi:hypothetical protein
MKKMTNPNIYPGSECCPSDLFIPALKKPDQATIIKKASFLNANDSKNILH